jgi:hypothetical protein
MINKKKTISISPVLTYINYDYNTDNNNTNNSYNTYNTNNRNTRCSSSSSTCSSTSSNENRNSGKLYLKISKSSNSDVDNYDSDYEYY